MAIMYNKKQDYTLLKNTFKVPQPSLDALNGVGASLKVGDAAISLSVGYLIKELSLNTLVSNAVKNPQPQHVVMVNAFVAEFIKIAQTHASTTPVAKPVLQPVNPIAKPAVKAVNITQSDVDKLPIVKLRDATGLYQRVHGTSGGSIYRVVALNDLVKVAVRIQGNAVSMRVEGTLDSKSVKELELLGIAKKSDEYMSGHFTCEKCTPQKLIGSILTGSGIAFDTPIPHLASSLFT